MIVAARPASAADATDLERLRRLAEAERASQRGGVLLDRIEPRPPLNTAASYVLVGLIDDVAVGFAQAHIDDVAQLGRIALLDELYVEPEAREVGVGESLIEELLAWAGAAGCAGVDSVVLPGNRAGKNFFERYGLVARAIRVHRPLG